MWYRTFFFFLENNKNANVKNKKKEKEKKKKVKECKDKKSGGAIDSHRRRTSYEAIPPDESAKT